jgi:aryl-alcohol dehydrogenase-like predicted oxidoreductase/adenylate kinase family enzyme
LLDTTELRVGLGCMRLPADEELALETVAAAAEAGMTLFDTARAYGDNERLVARALRACCAEGRARIVTKGGMSRVGDAWVPDGRAKTLRADCEASLAALDGLPIDLYLIHAPDPRTPWRTSLRALARLLDEGLVGRVGVANVNRGQLDEAIELAPVAAVQVALSVFDDRALRGGIVERCAEAGITLIAHSPLGGPRRAGGLARSVALAAVAHARDALPGEVALAWLLDLSPNIVAIPGARRPETARSAARAALLELDETDRETLAQAFGRSRPAHRPAGDGDVVLVMGIPGAGKTRIAEEHVTRGYVRLNRDERGGTLRALAGELEDALSAGERQVVLDNTYLTRPSRSYVVDAAARHGIRARCVWLDIPLAQAQVNLVERLLDRFDGLPTPEELRMRARREAGLLTPTSQMRALHELEPPSPDEGWSDVEQRAFVRASSSRTGVGVFVAGGALEHPELASALADVEPGTPTLLFDWDPDGGREAILLRAAPGLSGAVEIAVCPHGAGPPTCWCRPPLPGLPLAFARAHDVDPARSTFVGVSATHRTLATTLGATYIDIT